MDSLQDRGRVQYYLGAYVGQKIARLQDAYLGGGSWAKASLAQLRKAAGAKPGANPGTWAIEFEGMPEALAGRGSAPSEGEWAVHLALTLYAVHQQSRSTKMFRESVPENGELFGLGNDARRLALTNEGEELELGQMPSAFAALVATESIQRVGYYARQVVHRLSRADISLDYVRLARQLYAFQKPYLRDGVRLEWGREFARSLKREETTEESN